MNSTTKIVSEKRMSKDLRCAIKEGIIKLGRDIESYDYMDIELTPPEQVAGNVLIPRSDFYSLAMTMIYALGGDVGKKEVPESVPEDLCTFLCRFLVRDVLARPGWDNEDFTDSMEELRMKLFGRRRSKMKPIPNF